MLLNFSHCPLRPSVLALRPPLLPHPVQASLISHLAPVQTGTEKGRNTTQTQPLHERWGGTSPRDAIDQAAEGLLPWLRQTALIRFFVVRREMRLLNKTRVFIYKRILINKGVFIYKGRFLLIRGCTNISSYYQESKSVEWQLIKTLSIMTSRSFSPHPFPPPDPLANYGTFTRDVRWVWVEPPWFLELLAFVVCVL